jgi:chemotaxis protein histidine kinase CheA
MDVFDEPQAEILADTLGLIAAQIRGEFATREDIQDLKESIRELAQAQARTEARVQELAEAQARTEARVQELAEAQARTEEEFRRYRETSEARFLGIEAALERLAEAQARTEARVQELAEAQARTEEEFRRYRETSEARFLGIEAALERLAEAQARTEARVQELAEAQARTEEEFRRYREASEVRFLRIEAALERLAEAQARTEEEFRRYREASEVRFLRIEAALERLAEAQARTERKVDHLARQVGGLSETIGGDLEDIAYIVLHRVLQQKKGWQVGEVKRVWQRWDGQKREVNIFGEARDPARPAQRIWIVGEAKHNLTMLEVERFARTVEMARRNLEGEIFPVCFCYRARPEVQERIRELGFHIVFSYGELVESAPGGEG